MTLRGLAHKSARLLLAENCWCLGMRGAVGVVARKGAVFAEERFDSLRFVTFYSGKAGAVLRKLGVDANMKGM